MALPFLDPGAIEWLTYTPDERPTTMRFDSPVDNHGYGANGYFAPKEKPKGRAMSTETHPKNSNGGLRFFVVDHPDQLKDREQMRQNRKHVMQDYLVKERLKPGTTDLRAIGPTNERRRSRATTVSIGSTSRHSTPTDIPDSLPANHTSQPGRRESSRSSVDRPQNAKRPSIEEHEPPLLRSQIIHRRAKSVPDDLPLVSGSGGRTRISDYLDTSPNQVPFPLRPFGSGLNPFDTWPTFADTTINVSELKLKCSQRFGSKGLAEHWVPSLLRARHAFLSTVCISSAHDDIMSRASRPASMRSSFESFERMRVRAQVIKMINQSMEDPDLQTADSTIIAVLQLLNAEIMGCDDGIMNIHQKGLHDMVRQRGGMEALGVNGYLASILTITMFMIAILRETTAHPDFQAYARKQVFRPPEDTRPLPESPLFSRANGFSTVKEALSSNPTTYEFLEEVRRLTNAFFVKHSTSATTGDENRKTVLRDLSTQSILTLKRQIFSWSTADFYDFPSMSQKYMFEAIRLTSLVYAHALEQEVSFSAAATALKENAQSPSSSTFGTSYGATPDSTMAAVSLPVQIKLALMRSDLSDCWGRLGGVLFWIVLVAGAAANPGPPDTNVEQQEAGEEEEARKWLAAVAVRCSILLSFEFGGSILESLKRMVGIQQALARGTVEGYGVEVKAVPDVKDVYGPREAPKGFTDFAQDFLNI